MSAQLDSTVTPAVPAFRTTHWSVVLTARDLNHSNSERAMASLCQQYWYPLYAFIRRKGKSAHDAQDLAQEFFARLIEKEFLRTVDREKGRFRTFLLTTVQRFLCNEWEKSQAQKRGGGVTIVSWDHELAENLYLKEPSDQLTPEKLFDRRWALTLLEAAMTDLKAEYARAGKEDLLRVLQPFIIGEAGHGDYAAAAASLELSEGAARVWVHRIRRRYGELLRAKIAETVDSEAAVEEELRSLYAALGAP